MSSNKKEGFFAAVRRSAREAAVATAKREAQERARLAQEQGKALIDTAVTTTKEQVGKAMETAVGTAAEHAPVAVEHSLLAARVFGRVARKGLTLGIATAIKTYGAAQETLAEAVAEETSQAASSEEPVAKPTAHAKKPAAKKPAAKKTANRKK